MVCSLPAAPDQRVFLQESISRTYLFGAPGAAATVTRQYLTSTELDTVHTVHFSLRLRNFDELRRRVEQGEVLTLQEMSTRYFPSRESWSAVARWAADEGLNVEPSSTEQPMTVTASGTVRQVQKALQMRFARVYGTDGQEYTSAISAPSVAKSVKPEIVAVTGLQPHMRPLPQHVQTIRQLDGGWILPQTFAQLYEADELGLDGQGQTIVILGGATIDTNDLTAFWRACGLSTTLSQYRQVDISPYRTPDPSNRAGEETMNVEWASAMAPGADIIYLSSLTMSEVAPWIISQIAAGRKIGQLSTSFGLPEAIQTDAATRESDNQYYAALAALGVSIFVASGDEGSTQLIVGNSQPGRGYNANGTTSPLYPASNPFVTGVGGTAVGFSRVPGELTAGFPVKEGAWTLSNRDPGVANTASGGGISWYFERPSWQRGPGVPEGTKRCVPDVAAMASNSFPNYFQFMGARFGAAGTSVSAPIWAGLCALINQARAKQGLGPLGLLGPRLYPLNGSMAFSPMTTGAANGDDYYSTEATNGAYKVGPGYTLITGLGSPDIEFIIAALMVPDPEMPPKEPDPPAPPKEEDPPAPPENPSPPEPDPPPPPDPEPPAPPAPEPQPPTSPPASSRGGGGGGALSIWFAMALGILLIARRIGSLRNSLLALNL